jgi:hypothetical protein
MHANGHTTVWGTPIDVSPTRDAKEWSQQLKVWWAAHQGARQEATPARLRAHWDARREAVRPAHADAAIDMVASTHACSTTMARCDLSM